jgi:hypothetical protein
MNPVEKRQLFLAALDRADKEKVRSGENLFGKF